MPSLDTHFTYSLDTPLVIPPHPSHSHSTLLNLAYTTALSLVHNHHFMMHLNPYIAEFNPLDPAKHHPVDHGRMAYDFHSPPPDPRDVVQYVILDKLPILFGHTTDLTYRSAMANTPDGMDSYTDPGSGVEIHGVWTVKRERIVDEHGQDTGEERIILSERAETKCNWFLSLYIKASLNSSHSKTHERFAEEWRRRVRDALMKSEERTKIQKQDSWEKIKAAGWR